MFLEVITRTFGGRPHLLARNTETLQQQSDPDWIQTVVLDNERRGVSWANRNLATIEASGDYVWVLDDDDLCCRPSLVAELKTIIATAALPPDVIVVRAYHAVFGMLPSDANWEREPVCGNIGSSCLIVSRETWNMHRDAWPEEYAGDYVFIRHLWDTPDLRWHWHDHTAAYYPQQSIGATE